MPPVDVGDDSLLRTAGSPWIAIIVFAIVVVTLLLTVLLCGGKKEETAPGGGADEKKTDGGGSEKKKEGDEKKDGGGKSPGAEEKKESNAYLDLSQPGLPAEEKKRTAPEKKGIDESNPAYATLINESKFEASKMAKTKGIPPPPAVPNKSKMSMVAGSNPAYATLLTNSKFEASQTAPKTTGGTTMKTAMPGSQKTTK